LKIIQKPTVSETRTVFPKNILMKTKQKLIIAIDGPAASGKSTTARLVAKKLGYLYIDTGAMYRALTYAVLQQGIDVENEQQVSALAKRIQINLIPSAEGLRTYLNDEDISEAIRLPAVTKVISRISAYKEVREIMKVKQRDMSRAGAVVMDGRDIGTVVLPDANIKIYMQAGINERTKRRVKELREKGRDKIDSTRHVAPLKPAKDAYILDTSNLTIKQQVEKVLDIIDHLR
jgi:cytidylate kinase